ncbi:unnamed protein product [Linum trigynum]|uniref:Uncharacterized protein n=1 Tax=Linum trigynum TaxID=586398 RepID=A0AAV2F5A3_9ROSI
MLAVLEIKWFGIELEEWWRNEQFWLIGGTSAHLAAVLQGLLKVVAGIEISFTLTSKSGGDDVDDEFADLYIVKWTSLMTPPIVISDCDSGGGEQDDIQRDSAVEQAAGRGVLQLLGAGSSLSICQGADGEEKDDADDRVCVVGAGGYHHIFALGGHQSSIEH